jgi:RND family efflux transporter MFP subunit
MQYTAVVDASQKADLSFKVGGELVELLVKQGDEVSKGQILARLNDKDIQIQLDDAQSSYDKSEADYDRGINLAKKNVISNSDFDQLKALYSSSKARLDTARNNLKYTELLASFDGVVAKKYAENFQEVNARQPIMALNNIEQVHLKIDVPESVMIQIPRNDRSRDIVAIFSEIPGQEFPVEFKEVSLQADEVTKTYEVTFSMDSPPNHTVLPGMSAILKGTKRLSIADNKKRFILPSNSVLKDRDGHYVFIVEKEDDDKARVLRKKVSIGDITADGIEVFSGVTSGQHLITAGVSKVTDGMLVKWQE